MVVGRGSAGWLSCCGSEGGFESARWFGCLSYLGQLRLSFPDEIRQFCFAKLSPNYFAFETQLGEGHLFDPIFYHVMHIHI